MQHLRGLAARGKNESRYLYRMLLRPVLFSLLFAFALPAFAQSDTTGTEKPQPLTESDPPVLLHPFFTPASSFNKKRTAFVISSEATLSTGSLIALSQLWYNDYPRTNFHSFNDNGEWLQMDKCGHAITAYTVGGYGFNLLKWGGVKRKKAIWYGGLTGFAYLSVIEIFDGFSSGWGFSSGDMLANTGGCGLFIGQELLWHEQRIVPKFGFRKSGYAQYRPSLLGSNFSEQLIKDYNGQTYWLSVNIASFIPGENHFPEWLNLAFGYGANGMVGGHENPPVAGPNGTTLSFERYRQFYIAPDIDLTKIPVHSPFLKTVFGTFGFLKIPLPGIEISRGKMIGLPLAY